MEIIRQQNYELVYSSSPKTKQYFSRRTGSFNATCRDKTILDSIIIHCDIRSTFISSAISYYPSANQFDCAQSLVDLSICGHAGLRQ